jgi:hypothetical protein
VAAAGRIYLFEDTGRCTVLADGADFQVLAKNDLNEEVYTTPAISNGRIFIRTTQSLICISPPAQQTEPSSGE